ncbi:hypothetical protein Tco_0064488 [Tanacetum coccineum]
MRTRSQSRNPNLPQQEASPAIVEPLRIEYPVQDQPQEIPMADNRTMAQLLEAYEGYEDCNRGSGNTANILRDQHGLLILVQYKTIIWTRYEVPTCSYPLFQQDHFYDEVSQRPEYVG